MKPIVDSTDLGVYIIPEYRRLLASMINNMSILHRLIHSSPIILFTLRSSFSKAAVLAWPYEFSTMYTTRDTDIDETCAWW